jgi:UDP-N-acetylglucosamine 3-dehydrogenase
MLNIAVIGVGNMGKNHARIYFEHPDINLVAVCDIKKDRADDYALKYKCKAYYDVESLLQNEKLDGVSIVVPTLVHKEIVEKVVPRKINILLEKPVSSNLKDAEIIRNIIKENNVVCVCGHIERYNPGVRKSLEMVFNNDLGKLIYINAIREGLNPQGFVDVDALTNLGIHDLEIINYIIKNIPDSIDYFVGLKESIINKLGDLFRISIKTNNKCVINLVVDTLTPIKKRELYICGEKGLLSLDYISQKLVFYTNGSLKESYSYSDILRGVTSGETININFEIKEPLFLEIDNFIKSIKGIEKPFVGIDDAVESIMLLEKIQGVLNE